MCWLAVTDFTRSQFSATGLAGAPRTLDSDLLVRGSLVFEAAVAVPDDDRQILLDYQRQADWTTRLTVMLNPNGRLTVALRQGDATSLASVTTDLLGKRQSLRMTYSWDAPARRGVLSVENLETGSLRQVEFGNPQALPLQDVEKLARLVKGRQVARGAVFLAVSAEMEPVGIMPTIAQHSPVATPQGERMIEDLRPGDFVMTAANGPKAVRWVGFRDLPMLGGYRPLRLRAPYFGLKRDLLVAPEQRLLISGAQIEYQFGSDEVLVEAQHLINGISVLPDLGTGFVRYYQILLDDHEIIQVAGTELDTLYIGALRDNRAILDTTILRHMPRQLIPDQDELARPILHEFEAMTLQTALAG